MDVIEPALDLLIPGLLSGDLTIGAFFLTGIDRVEESQERGFGVSLVVLQGELVDAWHADEEQQDAYS